MRIDVWSDLVCPWCYIGKRRLESALADFEHRDAVEVVYHSFQLHPDMPAGATVERREMLKANYRLSDDQVATMDERLEQVAAEDGLDFDLSGGVTGNTFDAHRLVHHAAEHGKQDDMAERLFRAYFTEQRSIFDRGSLAVLAAEVGLDADEAMRVLDSNAHGDVVRADHDEASRLGARGVPFFVIGGRFGVSGAQPVETFVDALKQGWDAAQQKAG